MKEFKGTKGEWYNDNNTIRDKNGYVIASCICKNIEEQNANAKLIASAPDLLKALIDLQSWAINKGIDVDKKLFKKCEKAISKALD